MVKDFLFYSAAAFFEIFGCYAFWLALKLNKGNLWLSAGVVSLILFAWALAKIDVAFAGKAIMTSDQHRSGTDRCQEAFTKLDEYFDVIINVQGDEPFIQPEQITELQKCFDDNETQIATLARKISETDGLDILNNPNCPKLVLNKNNEALYFSRSVIPFKRGAEPENWLSSHPYLKHIGIYAYRAEV